jgi:hypothetical protein
VGVESGAAGASSGWWCWCGRHRALRPSQLRKLCVRCGRCGRPSCNLARRSVSHSPGSGAPAAQPCGRCRAAAAGAGASATRVGRTPAAAHGPTHTQCVARRRPRQRRPRCSRTSAHITMARHRTALQVGLALRSRPPRRAATAAASPGQLTGAAAAAAAAQHTQRRMAPCKRMPPAAHCRLLRAAVDSAPSSSVPACLSRLEDRGDEMRHSRGCCGSRVSAASNTLPGFAHGHTCTHTPTPRSRRERPPARAHTHTHTHTHTLRCCCSSARPASAASDAAKQPRQLGSQAARPWLWQRRALLVDHAERDVLWPCVAVCDVCDV